MTSAEQAGESRRREIITRGVRWSFATAEQCRALAELDGQVIYQSGLLRMGKQSPDHPDYRLAFERHAIALHLMLVSARNMIRAIDMLAELDDFNLEPVPDETRELITLLRDYSEHWNEHGAFAPPEPARGAAGRAGRQLAERHPDSDPSVYKWTDGLFGRVGDLHVIHVRWLAEAWQAHFLGLEQSNFIWDARFP